MLAAKKYGLSIDGIIDENKNLIGYVGDCYIAPLTKHPPVFDVAIITNTLFFFDVKKQIETVFIIK